jgi:elongation factor P
LFRGILVAVDTSSFKNGMAIRLDGEVFSIIEFQHVKPGKGGAFVRTRLKNLRTDNVFEKTFRAGEKVEPVYLEKKKYQYLYQQGDEAILMDLDTYEQIHVDLSTFGEGAKYLKEEMEVASLSADGEVLGYEIPNFVELQVVEADPSFRGNTVSGSSTKWAKVETGAMVQVPFHISEGDILKIDTRTGEYIERVKR